ncbi:hypothetical protein [Hydrogenophaga sp. T2]|uniref:hypothetical protein n=1 Tax=Hydrogenophaga sp. T2 TaxID=3132823 RepID=UPI003CFB0B1B
MPVFSRSQKAPRFSLTADTPISGPPSKPRAPLVEIAPRAPESKAFSHINKFLGLFGKKIRRQPSLRERRQATANAVMADQQAGLTRQPDEIKQAYAGLVALMAKEKLSAQDWQQIRADKTLLAKAHLTDKFRQADDALGAVNEAFQGLHHMAAADNPSTDLDDDFGLPQPPETLGGFMDASHLVRANWVHSIQQAGETLRRDETESVHDFRQRQKAQKGERRFLKNAGTLPWNKLAWSPRNAHASSLKRGLLSKPDAAHIGAQGLMALMDEPRAIIEELDGAWATMLSTAQDMPAKSGPKDFDRVKDSCAEAAATFEKAVRRLRDMGSVLTHDTWATEKLSLGRMEGLHRFGLALLGLSKQLAAPDGVNVQSYLFARRAASGDQDAIEQLRNLRVIDLELDFSSVSSEDDEAQDTDLESSQSSRAEIAHDELPAIDRIENSSEASDSGNWVATISPPLRRPSSDTLAEVFADRLAESTKALYPAREWSEPARRNRPLNPSPSRRVEIDVQAVARQEAQRALQIRAELRHAEVMADVLETTLKELRGQQGSEVDNVNVGAKLLPVIPLRVQGKRIKKAEARYQAFQAKVKRISEALETARAQQAQLSASLSAIGDLADPDGSESVLKAAAVAAAHAQEAAKDEAERAAATARTAKLDAQGDASKASAAAEAEAITQVMAKVYVRLVEAHREAEGAYHRFLRDQPSAQHPAPIDQDPAAVPTVGDGAPNRAYAPRRLARQQRAQERRSSGPEAPSRSPLDADDVKTLLTDLQSDLERLGTSPTALAAVYDSPFSPRPDALDALVQDSFEASQAAEHRYALRHTEATLVALDKVMAELQRTNSLNGRRLTPEEAKAQLERIEADRQSALALESDQMAREAAMAKPPRTDTQAALRADLAAAARALAQAKADAEAAAQDAQRAQALAAQSAGDRHLAIAFEVSAQVKAHICAGMADLHRRAEQALREVPPSPTARLDDLAQAIRDDGQRHREKITQRSKTQQPRAMRSRSEPLQPATEKLVQPAQALLVLPELDEAAVLPQADQALADAEQVLAQARSTRDELALLREVRSASSKLIEATALAWATEHQETSVPLRNRANEATALFDKTRQALSEQEYAVRNAEAALKEVRKTFGADMPDATRATPITMALVDAEVEAAVQELDALRVALGQAKNQLEAARLYDKTLVRPSASTRQASLKAVRAAEQDVQAHELLVDWALNRLNMAQAAQKEALVRSEPEALRTETNVDRTPWVAPQMPAPQVARSLTERLAQAMEQEVDAQARIDQLPSNRFARLVFGKQEEYRLAVEKLKIARGVVQGLQSTLAEQSVAERRNPALTAPSSLVPQLEADLNAAQRAVIEARNQVKEASAKQFDALKEGREAEVKHAITEENTARARLNAHEAQVRALSEQLRRAQAAQ